MDRKKSPPPPADGWRNRLQLPATTPKSGRGRPIYQAADQSDDPLARAIRVAEIPAEYGVDELHEAAAIFRNQEPETHRARMYRDDRLRRVEAELARRGEE